MKRYRYLEFGLAVSILLFWGVVLWWMNHQTLFVSDDFRYHFMYESYMPSTNPKRINSFIDIMISMKNHYFMWGGRIPAHFLVQWALWWGKAFFNIMNTLVYLSLIGLIYYHSRPMKSNKSHLWKIALIPFALWWWIPQFGMTVLWISGACNYLVGTTIIVAFIGYYQRFFQKDILQNTGKFEALLLFIAGIIAGWTNENTAGAMLVMGALFGVLILIKHRKLPLSYFTGGIGAIIGFALLLFAPGNQSRWIQDEGSLSEFIAIIEEFITVPATIVIGLFMLTFIFWKRLQKPLELLSIVLVYLLGSGLAVVVMLLSPERAPRTFFGAIVFLIIVIMMLGANLIEIIPKGNLLPWGLALLLISPWVCHANVIFKDLNETSEHWIAQYVVIEQAKKDQQPTVEIEGLPFYPRTQYNPYWRTASFTSNSDSWFNSWAAAYFEIQSITMKTE